MASERTPQQIIGDDAYTQLMFEGYVVSRPTPVAPVSPDATGKCGELVTVKPLEWRKYRNGDAEAVTPFGEIYTAYLNGYWRITRNGKAGKFIKATGGDDVDAAKAGAQADFDANVLRLVRSQTEELLAAERAKLTKEEADHTRSLEERDRYHDVADKLAHAIADRYQSDIGEHSSVNDPWQNALNLIEADNAALTAEISAISGHLDCEADSDSILHTIREIEADKAIYKESAEALEAKLAAAEKALEPFAEYCGDHFDKDFNGNPLPDEQKVGWVYLNYGHFRRARAVMGGKPS
ncbi:hypothetical protein HGK82_22365 [Ochrobactrum sp. MT180101]|nr:hypothetical protein HGK82_22365 [Ochrobactrum sp. MT180101]